MSKKKLEHFFYSLTHSAPGMVGIIIVLAVVIVALLADVLAPYDPAELHMVYRLLPPSSEPVKEGMVPFYLGTDSAGRDVLSRIIYGSRISLVIGFVSAVLGGLIGVVFGLFAGYFGGKIDSIISWLTNVQLSMPYTLLAIFIMAIFGQGLDKLIIVLAWGAWVNYARVIRGQVMAVKEMEYVSAAKVLGVRNHNILTKYVLANSFSPVIIVMTFTVASSILSEASLSFLGLGVEPTVPTWGSILSDGRSYLEKAWWIATFPGIAIFVTVMGINLFGDWIRDYIDPRMNID